MGSIETNELQLVKYNRLLWHFCKYCSQWLTYISSNLDRQQQPKLQTVHNSYICICIFFQGPNTSGSQILTTRKQESWTSANHLQVLDVCFYLGTKCGKYIFTLLLNQEIQVYSSNTQFYKKNLHSLAAFQETNVENTFLHFY